MIEENTRYLIEAGYDAELTVAERELLAEILEQSAEARRYREEIEQLGVVLREVVEPEPPLDLRDRILAVIPNGRARDRAAASRWARPGFALAAAVILAVPLVWMMKYATFDGASERTLTGSMVGSGEVTPSYHVAKAGIDASVALTWRGDGLVVELGVTSDEPIETTVEYPADRFVLVPSKELRSSMGKFEFETSGARTVTASLQSIERELKDGQRIRVVFARQGRTIDSTELAVPPRS